jgi:hypothetical protein
VRALPTQSPPSKVLMTFVRKKIWVGFTLALVSLISVWLVLRWNGVELESFLFNSTAASASVRQDSAENPSNKNQKKSTATSASKAEGTLSVTGSGSNSPMVGSVLSTVSGAPGMFNQSMRALIASDDPYKIDYGIFRLSIVCAGISRDEPITQAEHYIELSKDHSDGVLGNANPADRVQASIRAAKKCKEADAAFSDEEIRANREKAIRLQSPYFKLVKLRNGESFDFTNPEVERLMIEIIKKPYLGSISMQPIMSLDFAELDGNGSVIGESQRMIAQTLILCRLGDDCSSGSLVSETFCVKHGVCGGRVEDALINYYASNNLDFGPMDRFVRRIQDAFARGDTSVFQSVKKKS